MSIYMSIYSHTYVLNTLHLKSVQPVASTWPLRGWKATHVTVDLIFLRIILDTHQSPLASYVHTGTDLAPEPTAKRLR
jgi:hypothetical protein